MRDESDDYKLPADDSIRVEREMEEINKKKKKKRKDTRSRLNHVNDRVRSRRISWDKRDEHLSSLIPLVNAMMEGRGRRRRERKKDKNRKAPGEAGGCVR